MSVFPIVSIPIQISHSTLTVCVRVRLRVCVCVHMCMSKIDKCASQKVFFLSKQTRFQLETGNILKASIMMINEALNVLVISIVRPWRLFSKWSQVGHSQAESFVQIGVWSFDSCFILGPGQSWPSDVQVFHSPVGPYLRYSPRLQSCSGWKPQCCLTLLPLAPWSLVTRVQWLKCTPSKQDTPSRMRYVIRRLWWLHSENQVVRYAESHCQCS